MLSAASDRARKSAGVSTMVNLTQRLREEVGALPPGGACCAAWELLATRHALGAAGDELPNCTSLLSQRLRVLAPLAGLELLEEPASAARRKGATTARLTGLSRLRTGRLKRCCRGAILRGAVWRGTYLGSEGHLEVAKASGELLTLLSKTRVPFHESVRKGRRMLYLKDQEAIAEAVGKMGAFATMLLLEDQLVSRRMRSDVNRVVNCEVGNLSRTGRSSVAMLEDIRLLEQARGLEMLPVRLREVARLRMRFPTASLRELARRTRPVLTKSGMQHRLEELSRLAQQVRRESS